ncbi:carbamate kinase [Asanoa hainanensis]|uniref:Carbamate kinase n=1 Tax=Asanoa hainanensis TaxID=560556 RepID=A0A239GP40_9ACTN|nr:carbamate kinase [Asanoa hainanensis]SNS70927.1 carbamate kinase [Asanoa hainanensis]
MQRTAVVALGGNAFTRAGQRGTQRELASNATAMAQAVHRLRLGGWRVVVAHGNGPQVGNLAIQHEAGEPAVPALPLPTLVAMTQGQLGSLFCLALREVSGGRPPDAVTLVSHVRVDAADPAFTRPTKPIGPFLSAEDTARHPGWTTADDAGRGHRRVVASPPPLEIVEIDAIRKLLDEGFVVVAAGGGGVPVAADGDHLVAVEAVIDKDLAAALLATAVGATALVLVTDVDTVMLDFGTPRERAITTVGADEMRGHLRDGQFPEGSMGPKVRAALRFLDAGGGCAVITRPWLVPSALSGDPGRATRIVRGMAGRGAA